jgi:hypothetical protein
VLGVWAEFGFWRAAQGQNFVALGRLRFGEVLQLIVWSAEQEARSATSSLGAY